MTFSMRLGDALPVMEEFPEFDAAANAVVWSREAVMPWPWGSTEGAYWHTILLGPTQDAFAAVFSYEATPQAAPPPGIDVLAWRRHCIACRAVVCELAAAASGRPLLELLLE